MNVYHVHGHSSRVHMLILGSQRSSVAICFAPLTQDGRIVACTFGGVLFGILSRVRVEMTSLIQFKQTVP